MAKLTEVGTQLDKHVKDKKVDLKVDKQIQTLSQDTEDI